MVYIVKIGICVMVTVILLSGAITSALGDTEYDYIDITNPFLRKNPVAIPQFRHLGDNSSDPTIARKASSLLSDTLVFTGYFKVIDEAAYLVDEENVNLLAPSINFGNWTGIGAELLITGGVALEEGLLALELRLYDTFKEDLVIGKRYKGRPVDYRRMVRRFAGEIIYHISGSQGFFNSKIAFLSDGSGSKEIYMAEFDGFNPVRHTHKDTIILSPSWSSDGKWLAYTSYSKGRPDLYIEHVDEKRGSVLSRNGVNISPSWVPGKFMLGATLSYSGDQEIYLLTGTGKMIKRLTHSRGIDVSPSFSPDGKRMAFVSRRSGTPQIHTMELESKAVSRLTFYGRYNTQPSWSPTGEKIAYTGFKDGKSDIFVIGVDGKGLAQLTHDSGDNESPTWSPDGSLIAFSSTREGPSRIYVMTAFGTDQRRLLILSGEQTAPEWSPNLF